MDDFAYVRPGDVDAALRLAAQPGAQFIAGGTNLIDLMKGGVEGPTRLVDITHIQGLSATRCCRRRFLPERRRSCAIWPPTAAICSSAPAVRSSMTPVSVSAINVSRDPDARRLTDSIATTPS